MKDRWVVNKSSVNLSETETEVLQKGVNFAPIPSKIPVIDIITEVEAACIPMDEDQRLSCISKVICNYKTK